MDKNWETVVVSCNGVADEDSLFFRLACHYTEEAKNPKYSIDHETCLGADAPDKVKINPRALRF